MDEILKPKLSSTIGMLLVGVFLTWTGFSCATLLGNIISIIPGIFGLLGFRWVIIALAMLLSRNRLSIRISTEGIELPTGTPFRANSPKLHIPRSNIKSIIKHKSLRRRGIEIIKEDGTKAFIQIRQYCAIDHFRKLYSEMAINTAYGVSKNKPIDADAIRKDSNES